MSGVPVLETNRLLLRGWRDGDLPELARMYADPEVMRYIGDGHPRSLEESRGFFERIRASWAGRGFGLWAAELKETGRLVGRLGLSVPEFLPEVLPAVEVGWLIDRPYWGQGLATEGAEASLRFAFEELRLERVLGICDPRNVASERVMQKLGLVLERRTLEPELGLPLLVYAVTAADWRRRALRS